MIQMFYAERSKIIFYLVIYSLFDTATFTKCFLINLCIICANDPLVIETIPNVDIL